LANLDTEQNADRHVNSVSDPYPHNDIHSLPHPDSYPDRYSLADLDVEQNTDGHPNLVSDPYPHNDIHSLPNTDSHPDRNPLADIAQRHPIERTKGIKDA
jgi:hypothetical protein